LASPREPLKSMSGLSDCCSPCPETQTVNVPGVAGDAGAAGADGTNGVNAFTVVAADFIIPAVGNTVLVTVGDSTWMVVGQNIFIEEPANFVVDSIPGPSTVLLEFLGYTGDASPGATISTGAGVSPGGLEGPSSVGALPTAITDNSTGTASDTVAAGVGVTTLMFHINLVALTTAAADLMTNYTPGYAFKILAVDFTVTTPGTGAGANQSLNLEIGSTNVTGGVVNVTLANTATLGALVAGTAVTAANTGTAADTLSIEVAAGGTIFTAGQGILLIKIQNMDSANAVASLADHINDLITALT